MPFLQALVDGMSHAPLGADDVSDGAVGGSSWHWHFLLVRDVWVRVFFKPAVQKLL